MRLIPLSTISNKKAARYEGHFHARGRGVFGRIIIDMADFGGAKRCARYSAHDYILSAAASPFRTYGLMLLFCHMISRSIIAAATFAYRTFSRHFHLLAIATLYFWRNSGLITNS